MSRNLWSILLGSIVLTGITACGVGARNTGGADDARAIAIQHVLDQRAPTTKVLSGRVCDDDNHAAHRFEIPGVRNPFVDDVPLYSRVSYVRITPAGIYRSFEVVMRCVKLTWSPSSGIRNLPPPDYGGANYADALLGHYVVDKVGEEQDGAMGLKVTPYKAHVVLNELAKSLIAARVVRAPADVTDGQVLLRKDADGKWIAQL